MRNRVRIQCIHQLFALVVIMGSQMNCVMAQALVTRACSLQVVVDNLLWNHHKETQITKSKDDAEVNRVTRYFIMNELNDQALCFNVPVADFILSI